MAAPLALAACGGGSSKVSATGSTATSTTTTRGGGLSNSAFTACLKQQGVTLPAGLGAGRPPGAGGAGTPGSAPAGPPGGRGGAGLSAKQQAAFQACASKLPNGGRFGGGGGFAGGANATQLKAYLTCLESNGVKAPTTPTTTPGTNPSGGPRGFNNPLAQVRNDPHFAAAAKKCQALRPSFGGAPTTTTVG